VITGPALLDYAEMTAKIGAAIGRRIQFQAISDERAQQNLLAHRLPVAMAMALVSLWREVREGLVATVTQDVQRMTGHNPIAFDEWARQNAAVFVAEPD
jgi:hypothetical protein